VRSIALSGRFGMILGSMTLRAAVIIAATLLIGCGGGDDSNPSEPAATSDAPPASAGPEPDPGAESASATAKSGTRLYFTSGEQFRPIERPLDRSGSRLESATEALLEGPTKGEQNLPADPQTQIPEGVEVRDVSRSDDGTAVAELSPEFMAEIPADAADRDAAQQASLNARLAQVTYTLTQFEGVEKAKVVSGGVAVKAAQERDDYQPPAQKAPRVVKPKGAPASGTRVVQRRLAALRYLPKSAIDGLNGYRTQQAVIAFQSWEGLQRDGIVGPATTAALAEARRPRPKGSGPDRRIEVFRSKGVALVIRNGRTKRAIHVSTGISEPSTITSAGTFQVFRKEVNSWSVPFQQWLPYASYFFQGIAFHEYPSVPPYPASHGCVRVPAPEAKWLYRFAKLGTAVIVH
jgi:peptidoglycan hydrolase-like protein with peptidoglycan-binding domain